MFNKKYKDEIEILKEQNEGLNTDITWLKKKSDSLARDNTNLKLQLDVEKRKNIRVLGALEMYKELHQGKKLIDSQYIYYKGQIFRITDRTLNDNASEYPQRLSIEAIGYNDISVTNTIDHVSDILEELIERKEK